MMHSLIGLSTPALAATAALAAPAAGPNKPSGPAFDPTFSCPDESGITPIYAIQGEGLFSPLVPADKFSSEAKYVTKGVVTQVSPKFQKGFFIQDPVGDNNPLTSDGLFVYGVHPDVKVGSVVCVRGLVKEYFNATQINADGLQILGTAQLPEPVIFTQYTNETFHSALERHEHMYVAMPAEADLRVTRNFGFDYSSRRNNMVLSKGSPLFKPTQIFPAMSPEALALQEENKARRIYLETDDKPQDGVIPFFPSLNAESSYFRVGTRVSGLQGIVIYTYGDYRLVVPPNFTITNDNFAHESYDREMIPDRPIRREHVRVASFNMENYFTTVIGGDANPTGGNRGAQSEEEFKLQRAKLVNALVEMDADLVGLMELENNGFGPKSSIQDLITELNSRQTDPSNHYAFVATPDNKPIGTDAITSGIIYRPIVAVPQNPLRVVEMPMQIAEAKDSNGKPVSVKAGMRPSIVQSFLIGGAFEEGKNDTLTVVVNHFKSKGSACYEEYPEFAKDKDPIDGQGRCNALRVSAAAVLGKELSSLEGNVISLGDYNAYGREDPIRVLTDYVPNDSRPIKTAAHTFLGTEPMDVEGQEVSSGAGLVNLNTLVHGAYTYSYSFDGELGNLDHAIGNKNLAKKVVSVLDWHINSAESTLFNYPKKFSGKLQKSENPFACSDHDPIVIDLNFGPLSPIDPPTPTPAPTSTVLPTPTSTAVPTTTTILPTPTNLPTPTEPCPPAPKIIETTTVTATVTVTAPPEILKECEVAPWSAWSPCSATCNSGISFRSRNLIGGESKCAVPQLAEVQKCNEEPCRRPIDPEVTTCKVNNGGCQQICKDTPTGAVCLCQPGYKPSPKNPAKCIDRAVGCTSWRVMPLWARSVPAAWCHANCSTAAGIHPACSALLSSAPMCECDSL